MTTRSPEQALRWVRDVPARFWSGIAAGLLLVVVATGIAGIWAALHASKSLLGSASTPTAATILAATTWAQASTGALLLLGAGFALLGRSVDTAAGGSLNGSTVVVIAAAVVGVLFAGGSTTGFVCSIILAFQSDNGGTYTVVEGIGTLTAPSFGGLMLAAAAVALALRTVPRSLAAQPVDEDSEEEQVSTENDLQWDPWKR